MALILSGDSGFDLPDGAELAVDEGGTGANNDSDARVNLGLGSVALQNADSVNITGGSVSGITNFSSTGIQDDANSTAIIIDSSGHVLPTSNELQDLGADSSRWRDLYLSGSTINLGEGKITTDGENGVIALIPPVTDSNPNPSAMVINSLGKMRKVDTSGGEIQSSDMDSAANTTEDVFETIDVGGISADSGTFGELIVSDSFTLPSGTTAERPANPVAGMIRFNTDRNYTEFYDGNLWRHSVTFEATGGTETTITDGGVNYKVHTFTSSGTFTVVSGSREVDFLVVAGGGGGGSRHGGGGGAGGYIESTFSTFANSYPITVGAGGSGASPGSNNGSDGSSSSVFDVTVIGGGYGQGNSSSSLGDGGSGGGSRGNSGSSSGGSGTAGQGNDGGGDSGGNGGGGGGGKSSVGSTGTSNGGGDGGDGKEWLDGNYYAGGGGGGKNTDTGSARGDGGLGGGGRGNLSSNDSTAGSPNTGGGGGGGGHNGGTNYAGNPGGSGIVIIRYQI